MWNGAVIGAQQGLSGRDNWGCERDCVDCWLMYSEWHEPCAPRRVNDTVAEREIPFFSSLACCQVPMRHQGLNVLRKVLWDRKSDPAGRVPPNWTEDRNRAGTVVTLWPQKSDHKFAPDQNIFPLTRQCHHCTISSSSMATKKWVSNASKTCFP